MKNKKAQRTNLRTINIVVYLPCAKVIYVDNHIIYYILQLWFCQLCGITKKRGSLQ